MSGNLLIPEQVAGYICGPDRLGYVDDICRQEVAKEYNEIISGLEKDQWPVFTDYMYEILDQVQPYEDYLRNQVQPNTKAYEIEQKIRVTEEQITTSCYKKHGVDEWHVLAPGGVWGPAMMYDKAKACMAKKYDKIDIDDMLGTFVIDGISRSFTETLKYISGA